VATDLGKAATELHGKDIAPTEKTDSGTMVRRGVDSHGVTIWELDKQTVAAVPSALRKSEEEDSASPRRSTATISRYEEPQEHPGVKRGIIYSAIGFISLMGLLVFFIGRGPASKDNRSNHSLLVDRTSDASSTNVDESRAVLDIKSVPAGGSVEINGEPKGVTPVQVPVASNTALEVSIRLAGHEEFRQIYTLNPGQTAVFKPTLQPHVAKLIVITKPPGATVFLDGEELGVTPFSESLSPGLRKLKVKKVDYKTVEMDVELLRDQQEDVNLNLKSTVMKGFVQIAVKGTWANVYLGSKQVGTTAKKFSLRAGRHRLRLKNPASGKEKSVTVNVIAGKNNTFQVDL
jgi:hypothetical protein